ncbi:hypothetical protein [Bradyrhizobium sp. 2TAF24]|uniref:hypothetical protein n=1 Tax=Bradyrhizobium sp. 2TAF24 TaxID=3233011 RepID=UPI003F91E941
MARTKPRRRMQPARAGAMLLALALGGLPAAPSRAQSDADGRFVADPVSGCKLWNPHPRPDETASWSGACVNGFAEGAGSLQWLHGGRAYERDDGVWKDGRQVGRGTQDWGTGRYDGELANGEPEGHGVLSLQTARYDGQFHNGKPNGSGTATRLDGLFKGTWKDGCLVGDPRRIAFGVPSATCQ